MERNPAHSHRLLARGEVADIFGVSPSTITRWAEAGKLPSIKTLGGHRRYDAEVILELAQYHTKEITDMEDLLMGVPGMYADHHVIAVRQALLALPGVEEVEASSAFKTVRVQYAANQVSAQEVTMALQDAGYAPVIPGSAELPPAGNGAQEPFQVPVSTGKKDPAWAKLDMRTIETHPADMQMSGQHRN